MRIPMLIAAVAGLTQPAAQPEVRTSALNPADLDRECQACSDFNRFANGGWLDRAAIPPGRSSWSTYQEVETSVRHDLDAIIAEGVVAARAGRKGDLAKIGTFYSTCMDEASADRAGVEPLRADLARIDAIRTSADATEALRHFSVIIPNLLFAADVGPDPFDARRMMLHLSQGGLTLPEAPLYTDPGTEGQRARDILRQTASKMFQLSGLDPARSAADAERVVDLETALARATLPPEETRDPNANHHPMTVAAANSLTPHWNWTRFLGAIGAPPSAPLNVAQPGFFTSMDKEIAKRNPGDWAAYLRWRLLRASATWLSKPFRQVRLELSAFFSGAKGERPRAELCSDVLSDNLGWALGSIYQQRHFTQESQRRGERMVANLKAAMAQRIREAKWMAPATRAKALAKLSAMKVFLGGPKRTPNYAALGITSGPFWANRARANAFTTRYYSALLARPVDREEWFLFPQEVSGGADPSRNAFQYPTGKFQPPFFDANADDASNYGALGATMGHEITHLFDDQGRQYDAQGNLRDWWTPGDATAYTKRARRLVDQFNATKIRGEQVNGALTLGENIADLGGLTIAYYALQRELKGKPRPLIDGFTPEQRFFLAWARNFRERLTPEALRRQVRSDVHAPSEARVRVPLANMPEFQRAFGCKPGDKSFLAPADQVRIW